MAINLLGQADSTLVSAATKAGMANTPADYSRTFESVSKNYHNTMMASAKMWGDIARAGTSMYMTYKANQKTGEAADPNTTGADSQILHDEARRLRTGSARLMGLPDPESKQQLSDYQKRQAELNAFGEESLINIEKLDTAMSNQNPGATRPFTQEQALTVQNLNTGKATALGNYVVPELGDDGKWAYTMYHDPKRITAKNRIPLGILNPTEIGKSTSFSQDDKYIETTADDPSGPKQRKYSDLDELSGSPILGMDGEKIRFNVSDVIQDVIPQDFKRQLQNSMEKTITTWGGRGLNSGVLNKTDGMLMREGVDDLITAHGKKAWYVPTVHHSGGGDEPMSFYGEYVGIDNEGNARPTRVSAEGFASLSPEFLQKAGVKDIPGTPKGIDAQDLQTSDNYLRVTQAMFNPGDPNYSEAETNKIFRDYKIRQINDRVAGNWLTSPKNPANQTQTTTSRPDQSGFASLEKLYNADMFVGGKGTYVSPSKINSWNNMGKAMQIKSNFGKGEFLMTWDAEKGTYFTSSKKVIAEMGSDVIPNKASMMQTINYFDTGEMTPLTASFRLNDYFKGIPDWDGSKYITKEQAYDKELNESGFKLFSPSTWLQ